MLLPIRALPLVFAYPFMKRFTYWPQAWLGLTFNWGALLGWAVVRGELEPAAFVLYAAGFFWTLGYDTIYAHQDRKDDPAAGVKSSARALGLSSKPWLMVFYIAASALFLAAGISVGLGWIFYLGLALGLAQLAWQVIDVDIDHPKDCLAKFRSNRLFGWILLGTIIAAQYAR